MRYATVYFVVIDTKTYKIQNIHISFRNIYVNRPPRHSLEFTVVWGTHFIFSAREVQGRSEKIHYQPSVFAHRRSLPEYIEYMLTISTDFKGCWK